MRENRENCLDCQIMNETVLNVLHNSVGVSVKGFFWEHRTQYVTSNYPPNDVNIYILIHHFSLLNTTVTSSVQCLIQGLWIYGLQLFFVEDNGLSVALLFTGPFLMSLQSNLGQRGFSLA